MSFCQALLPDLIQLAVPAFLALLILTAIAGFAPVMIMTRKAVSLLYQLWIHSELVRTFGPFEAVLNLHTHNLVRIAFHE